MRGLTSKQWHGVKQKCKQKKKKMQIDYADDGQAYQEYTTNTQQNLWGMQQILHLYYLLWGMFIISAMI